MAVTSVEQFKKLAVREIELPADDVSVSVIVQVKRVSMLDLASGKLIPNELLGAAASLFEGKTSGEKTDIKELAELMDVVVGVSLVSPKYDEIKEYLTDEQKYLIFGYAQEGVKALKNFRTESEDPISNIHSENVEKKSE